MIMRFVKESQPGQWFLLVKIFYEPLSTQTRGPKYRINDWGILAMSPGKHLYSASSKPIRPILTLLLSSTGQWKDTQEDTAPFCQVQRIKEYLKWNALAVVTI